MPETATQHDSLTVKRVDPYEINVDDMNERKDNINTTELQASVAEQGIIQPPIVRVRNESAEVPYTVIVGQRRTIAAQAAGLDEIPVIVRDLDDADALEASITENVDAFRESVSPTDRAKAVEQLKDLEGYSNQEAADAIGVSESTLSEWIEYARDEWEGTALHVDADNPPGRNSDAGDDAADADADDTEVEIDDGATKKVAMVRRMTGGGEAGEKAVEQIQRHDLSRKDVQEVKQRVDAGEEPTAAIKSVADEKAETEHATRKIQLQTTVADEKADAVESVAESYGMSTNEAAEQLITEALESRGEL